MRILQKPLSRAADLIDMLDWLEYVTFDSGPGQLMLKAVKFFNEFDPTAVKADDDYQRQSKATDGSLRRWGATPKGKSRERPGRLPRHFEAFMIDNEIIVTPETQESQPPMSIARLSRDRKRQLGQFFTPPATATAIDAI